MKNIISIIVFCFIFNFGFSEELKDIRIVKILDSNLFLSEDSLFIKLAEIKSPSLFSKDSVIAKRIVKYANNNILKFSLSYLPINQKTTNDTLSIYLFREYDLSTTCFNERYLEEGFGKYQRSRNLPINREYIEAEEEAQEDEVSIWEIEQIDYPRSHSVLFKYSNKHKEDKFDNTFTFNQFSYELYKQNKIFQFTISKLYTKYHTEESGSNLVYFFVPKIFFTKKYWGFNIGVNYISLINGEGPDSFLLPTGGINVGQINSFYAHFNFIDVDNMSFLSYGVTYKFQHPFTEITFGNCYYGESKWALYFNTRISILNFIQLYSQGKYNFDEEYGYFLLGIGFIINE